MMNGWIATISGSTSDRIRIGIDESRDKERLGNGEGSEKGGTKGTTRRKTGARWGQPRENRAKKTRDNAGESTRTVPRYTR